MQKFTAKKTAHEDLTERESTHPWKFFNLNYLAKHTAGLRFQAYLNHVFIYLVYCRKFCTNLLEVRTNSL